MSELITIEALASEVIYQCGDYVIYKETDNDGRYNYLSFMSHSHTRYEIYCRGSSETGFDIDDYDDCEIVPFIASIVITKDNKEIFQIKANEYSWIDYDFVKKEDQVILELKFYDNTMDLIEDIEFW